MAYRTNNDAAGCLGYLITIAIIAAIVGTCSGIDNVKTRNEYYENARKAVEQNDTYSAQSAYTKFLKKKQTGKKADEARTFLLSYYQDLPIYYKSSIGGIETNVGTFERASLDFSGTEFSTQIKELMDQKIENAYQEALLTGTIDGWNLYKQKVTYDYWRDADEQIQRIEDEMWSTEPKAWAAATKSGSLEAYNKYMELYPKGAHARQADKKVIDLSVAYIFDSEHGTLPSMDHSYYGGGSTSTISVTNDTQYTLTLLYSGPSSKRLVLSPHATQSLTLTNGNYKIAASVNSAGVRPYAGTETLSGGGYDISYYISSSTSTLPSTFNYNSIYK